MLSEDFQYTTFSAIVSNCKNDNELLSILPPALIVRYQMIPIAKENNRLRIAMSDPFNFYAIDDARKLTGMEIEAVIGDEQDISRAIKELYEGISISEPAIMEDRSAINVVNSLISQAIQDHASDIHIEPKSTLVRIRFRIDGMLREVMTLPLAMHQALISRIKIMADMDIAEKRLPQDGRIKRKEEGREIDFRVSTLPTIHGEKMAIRILDRAAVLLDIRSLGFSNTNVSKFQHLCSHSYGMVLVTGPTGSGKTTTLYAALNLINSPAKNLITVEDPVEYSLEGVNQLQINAKAGLTFASGLRSILRQDPNVIMVGEIRDSETADIAIRAALTGHLVFTTLHTNDAAGAVTRLLDMGVEPYLAASSVLGVVAQRLVRKVCPYCRNSYVPKDDSSERILLGLADDAEIALYRGTGCERCGETGYLGQMAIQEIMPVTKKIRAAIVDRVDADEIAGIAVAEGMRTMRQDGIEKALAGDTTLAEVLRVAYGVGPNLDLVVGTVPDFDFSK